MPAIRTEPMLSTYLHAKGGKMGIPVGGTFELTARCNFNCPMCYVHMNQNDIAAIGEELTAQQWISIAKEARDAGVVFLLLTGGEPFIRKDFFEIYNAVKAMGMMVSINTNGSMLDGEIRRQLLENPPFRINISLYGGCNETYRGMCGQDAFDRVLENIRALKEAGVDVRLSVSITQHNRQDLKKIHEIADQLQIPIRATSYMFPPIRVNGARYGSGSRLSAKDAAESAVEWDMLRFSAEEFAGRAENLKKFTAVEETECSVDLDEGISCRAGRSSFWMTWNGTMLPCGMLPAPTAKPLEEGFLAAWERIRQQTRLIHIPKECAACPKRSICGVCAAICITETGFYDQVPEYKCRMTDEIIEAAWRACEERNDSANAD